MRSARSASAIDNPRAETRYGPAPRASILGTGQLGLEMGRQHVSARVVAVVPLVSARHAPQLRRRQAQSVFRLEVLNPNPGLASGHCPCPPVPGLRYALRGPLWRLAAARPISSISYHIDHFLSTGPSLIKSPDKTAADGSKSWPFRPLFPPFVPRRNVSSRHPARCFTPLARFQWVASQHGKREDARAGFRTYRREITQ